MSEVQVPLVKGMALGGVVISAIGAASTVFGDNKKPTIKSISRDFIIGSVMVALIMQILPESSTHLIQFILGLVPLSLFQSGGSAVTAPGSAPFATAAALAEMVEDGELVKVGVPRF